MLETLAEKDWETLLNRIHDGKCTPFLGAGVCCDVLPLGSVIAQEWAKQHGYPMEDAYDLARVAQFLAVKYGDPMRPKEDILKRLFANFRSPDFTQRNEPHRVLAELPLPVYITTNYDNFMMQALKSQDKDPRQTLCEWNKAVKGRSTLFKSPSGYDPTPANPVVFHLHGHFPIEESLVLTEDDYLDFLVNLSRDDTLLPGRIQRAIAGSSLLFIGYRLADWDFRVLFRGLITSTEETLRRISVTVQLPPSTDTLDSAQYTAKQYLEDYFDNLHMRVYWGTAREFAAELRDRWSKFSK